MSKLEELRAQFGALNALVSPPSTLNIVKPMARKRLDGEDSLGGYPPAIASE